MHERQGGSLGIDMTHDRSNSGLDELERLLDAYGADQERWPQDVRARFAPVLSDRRAARLLSEAAALDRVLAHAPLPDPARRAALADRILAEARASRGDEAGRQPGTVIAWPGSRRARTSAPVSGSELRPSWKAAALLAASLALGIFIGALDLVPEPVSQIAEVVDFDSDLDQTAAVGEGLTAALDEDFL